MFWHPLGVCITYFGNFCISKIVQLWWVCGAFSAPSPTEEWSVKFASILEYVTPKNLGNMQNIFWQFLHSKDSLTLVGVWCIFCTIPHWGVKCKNCYPFSLKAFNWDLEKTLFHFRRKRKSTVKCWYSFTKSLFNPFLNSYWNFTLQRNKVQWTQDLQTVEQAYNRGSGLLS